MTARVLHGYLEEAARRHPDRIAVEDDDRRITYDGLDRLAVKVAGALAEGGLRHGQSVGVIGARSIRTIAAVYGVMKAGGAYVAIDPLAPDTRAEQILRDCRAGAVIHEGTAVRSLSVAPDAVWHDVTEIESMPQTSFESREVSEGDPAYIVYTSGSTGVPKGVPRTHLNGVHLVEWALARFGFDENDRFAGHTPLHFGPHRFDLYVSAAAGASLHPLPRSATRFAGDMADHIRRHRLTVWWSAASAVDMWASQEVASSDLASLRRVMFGAERLPPSSWRRLEGLLPQAEIYAFYGSSETGTIAYHRVGDLGFPTAGPYPLGFPCEAAEILVVGTDVAEAAPGEAGELLVGGLGVMAGYLNRPELDEAAFVTDPAGHGGTFFRTRDLVTRRDDGSLWLLGRLDDQVKIRGQRVEPGEIELVLRDHPLVREACVVPVTARGGNVLEAFVSTSRDVSSRELRRFVASRLPRFMVPRKVTSVERLPRTSSGKVDRSAVGSWTRVQSSRGSTTQLPGEIER